jgi:hypothetical protein
MRNCLLHFSLYLFECVAFGNEKSHGEERIRSNSTDPSCLFLLEIFFNKRCRIVLSCIAMAFFFRFTG